MTKSYTELLGIYQGYIKMWEVLTAKVTLQVQRRDKRAGARNILNNIQITIT